MPTATTAQTSKIKFVSITPVEAGTGFNDYWTGIKNRIAICAYQIFGSRGRIHGHDVDDWLQAESKIVKRIPVHVDEAEYLYTVSAQISGFTADELSVRVEPFRIFITAAKSNSSGDSNAQEIFEAIDLGQEIETNTVIAELNSGMLTISMRKAHMHPVVEITNAKVKSSATRSAQLRKRAGIAKRYADSAKDHLRRAVAKEKKARTLLTAHKKAGIVQPTPEDPPSVSWTEEAPHSPLG